MSRPDKKYRLTFDGVLQSGRVESLADLLQNTFHLSESHAYMLISSPPRILMPDCSKDDAETMSGIFQEMKCNVHIDEVLKDAETPFIVTQEYDTLMRHVLEEGKSRNEKMALILVQAGVDTQGAPIPSMIGPFAEDVRSYFREADTVAGIDDYNLSILCRHAGRSDVHKLVDKANDVFRRLLAANQPLRVGFALFPEEDQQVNKLLQRAEFRCSMENLSSLVFGSKGSALSTVKETVEESTSDHSDEILKRAAKHESLSVLPFVAMELMNEVASTQCSSEKVARIIKNDPVFTAKLLRIANSAYYGFAHEVGDIELVVAILGIQEMINFVCSSAVADVFSEKEVNGACDLKELWIHSVCMAHLSEHLAKRAEVKNQNLMFTAGLLHDIGKLFLVDQFFDLYEGVCKEAVKQQSPVYRMEAAVLGLSHAKVGQELASSWNMPESLLEAIGFHHQPNLASRHRKLAGIICLADSLYYQVMEPEDVLDEVVAETEMFSCLDEDVKDCLLKVYGCASEDMLMNMLLDDARNIFREVRPHIS